MWAKIHLVILQQVVTLYGPLEPFGQPGPLEYLGSYGPRGPHCSHVDPVNPPGLNGPYGLHGPLGLHGLLGLEKTGAAQWRIYHI